jgi:hypothetical protein
LIAEMEDGRKVVRHVLADDKTGLFVLWLHCFEDHGLIPLDPCNDSSKPHQWCMVSMLLRGKQFTVCTEITIILGTVRFTIRGGRLRYKRYDAHFLKKSSVELPFSSFGDHLINILRKVNRLIYAFKIN